MNLKKNKTKIIVGVVVFILICSLMGIIVYQWYAKNQVELSTTTTDENNEPQDLIDGMLAKMQAACYEEMKVVADLYLDAPHLDWKYNYYVEIIDGKISLSGIIYDEITYESDYELKYDEMMFVDGLPVETEKYERLQQIKEHKKYYILKSTTSNRYGYQIAVYESGDTYYFLAFSSTGVVERIHKIVID